MKMFKDSRGFIFSFGWDMLARKEDKRLICWCDPSGDWQIAPNNQAGSNRLGFSVEPEFITESNGQIIAYQPGLCIEMTYIGGMQVWNFAIMQAEKVRAIAA